MFELWSVEEAKKNIIKGVNNVTLWDYKLNGKSGAVRQEVKKAIEAGEEVYSRKLADALYDVLNMDLSSDKTRFAIQAGLERLDGITLVLGPGGSGKSLIYKAIAHCVPRTLCLAPTGIAAYNLSAQGWGDLTYTRPPVTIHSGLNLAAHDYFMPSTVYSVKEQLMQGKWTGITVDGLRIDRGRYNLILVDEISMVSPNLLDVLIAAAGELDIPMVFFGDPMQLRPVEVKDDPKHPDAARLASKYPGWNFFNSYGWMFLQGTGAARTIVLDSVYRQSDPGFKSMLNRMRVNEPTESDWELLESRTVYSPPEGALILCKRNSTVDKINAEYAGKRSLVLTLDEKTASSEKTTELKRHIRTKDGEMTARDRLIYAVLTQYRPYGAIKNPKNRAQDILYSMIVEGDVREIEKNNAGFSKEILLYPGDRVMITKNSSAVSWKLDENGKLEMHSTRVANGRMGWYLGIAEKENMNGERPAYILLDTDEVAQILPASFKKEILTRDGDYKVVAEAEQYPLRMAYATTYHKAQGLTLDKVHMILDGDRTNWKVEGLGYLGLSRCRTLEGLTISGLSDREFLEDKPSKDFMAHAARVSFL